MVNIISDKYVLGQSRSKSITDNNKEIKLDINLKADYKEITGAIIQGIVQDESQSPLEGALVQLISNEYNFIMNTTTNEDGSYNLDNIPLKRGQKIYAFYPNKKIPTGVEVDPSPFGVIEVDFNLEIDPTVKLAIITGKVSDFTTEEPIVNAILYLYSIDNPDEVDCTGNETLISVVRSNKDGYFAFSEISIGSYVVKATNLGYIVEKNLVTINTQPQIINLNFKIKVNENDENDETGQISGVVQDEMGNTFPNIDVILYSINEYGSEIPIAYTQTNREGFYIFNNILKGTYKVKSNQVKTVSVGTDNTSSDSTSPNFNGFIVSSSSSYITIEHDVGKDKIQLLNNAVKYSSDSYSFISNLGGSNNGMLELFVTIPTDGLYIMSIEYTSQDGMRGFKLRINEEEQNAIFLANQTNGVYEENALIFNTIVSLVSGKNTVKIYNDTGEIAPNIIKTTYQICGLNETINATKGRLYGVLTGLEETFVIGIGGPYIGSSTSSKRAYFELDFYTRVPNQYILIIQYISGDGDRPLKIDINGINSGGVYMVPKTNGWLANNAEIYSIPINLKSGKSTIKFYSQEGFVGPEIGNVNLVSSFLAQKIDITESIMARGATLSSDKTMVVGLGGPLNGSMTLLTYTLMIGIYNIFFSCDNERLGITYLKVDINGVNVAEFKVIPTNGEKLTYIMQATLEYSNIIKFYNDTGDYSPYVGNIQFVLIGSGKINTNAALGELNYEAKLSYNGSMVNLGKSQGSVYFPLKIPIYGLYKATIDYIVGDTDGATLSLYVHDRLYNVVALPSTNIDSVSDANEFIITAIFTGNNDSITFFNNDGGTNLNVGKIVIENKLEFIESYPLENVDMLSGATLVGGMITNVGKNLGIIRLNVTVPKSGSYDLIMSYVAKTNDTNSQVSANFVLSDINVNFEATNSMDIEDSKTQVVTLNLVQGLNIIQIHNS